MYVWYFTKYHKNADVELLEFFTLFSERSQVWTVPLLIYAPVILRSDSVGV